MNKSNDLHTCFTGSSSGTAKSESAANQDILCGIERNNHRETTRFSLSGAVFVSCVSTDISIYYTAYAHMKLHYLKALMALASTAFRDHVLTRLCSPNVKKTL